jgi:uncharacterized protein (DUF2141 family)
VPPTGGPKDTLPPRLVRTVPAIGSTNYKGKKVVLEFDEDIVLTNLNQQLIISPLQDNPYTYKLRRKRLEIEFEKPLPDSSTIFLNFRKGVSDLNEKQPVKDLRVAFSTGKTLDTLMVSGAIADLLTSKPVANVIIGLWPVNDTTFIYKQKPQYLTQSAEDGQFRLENVKMGSYELAAFIDANGNARWNGKQEPIAFLTKPLQISSDTNLRLILATVDEVKPKLERVQAAARAQAEIRFSEGLTYLRVSLGKDSLPRQPIDASGGTYRVYFPKTWTDTVSLTLIGIDSAGNRLDTVAKLSPYKIPRGTKQDTGTIDTLNVTEIQPQNGYYLPAQAAFKLPEPFGFSDAPPPLMLLVDSQKIATPLPSLFNPYRNEVHILLPVLNAKRYRIAIPTGLKTTTGARLRTDTFTLSLKTEETVGLIRGRVANKAAHTILEVLTGRGDLVRTLYDVQKFELTGLAPGEYYFRLTIDSNGNHLRDLPRYSKRTLGEFVLPPTDPVQVKANWEVEVGDLFTTTP